MFQDPEQDRFSIWNGSTSTKSEVPTECSVCRDHRFIVLEKVLTTKPCRSPDQPMALPENGKTTANQRDPSHHCTPSTARAVTHPNVGVISAAPCINPFSSSATNISIYHVLMIMPPLLHIFAPYSPWHNLQQFKYSKKLTAYILLTSLCASCFCTVCPLHLVRVRLNMWMGEDSACQCAICDYSKQNKAHRCLSSGH